MIIIKQIPRLLMRDPTDVARACRAELFATVQTNVEIIRKSAALGRPIPSIYDAGVFFCREPWAGKFEEFANICQIIERGWADCDDACGWVCASYWAQGSNGLAGARVWPEPERLKAGIKIYWRPKTEDQPMTIYHAQVRLPDGTIEDPSRRLPGG